MASVLITGSSQGIGRAVAVELAARGHRVVATARDPRALDELEVDQRLALDVTDPGSIAAAVAAAGEIEVLISNAGAALRGAVEALPADALTRLFALNTVGALQVAQALLPGMRARGRGRLLFMSSVTGRVPMPLGGGYAATKFALEALVEALASEIARFGLEATLLEPGAVRTGGATDAEWVALPDDPYAALSTTGARQQAMSAEEVAVEVAEAVDSPSLPLRIPIGDAARRLLAARDRAAYDAPFDPVAALTAAS